MFIIIIIIIIIIAKISRVWQNQVAKSGPSEIVSWKVALTLARATVDVPWRVFLSTERVWWEKVDSCDSK